MKSTKFILLIFTIFAIHFFSENKVHAQTDISDQFTWGQMIHGGGFVTGMHIHPSGDPIFCRADVAGAYRWNSQKNEWKNVVTAASLPNEVPYDYKGVISIVSAPGDANRAYMAYNENLYYSNNKGDAWSVASSQGVPQLKMGTNDRTGRFDGERLSVDPKNNDVVYYGSNQDGLLRSIDGGKNWSVVYSGGKVQTSGGEYPGIVPVVDGASSLTSGRSSIVYFTSYGEGIYKSTNGGDSFLKIHDTRAEDLEINDQGVLFACSEIFLVKYENNSFSNISPGNRRWTDIAVNGSELWVIDRGGSNFYYSADKGANWTKQATNYTSQDVPWLPTEDGLWRSVGELEYNPATGALWMSEGVGVWMCANPVASTTEWYSRTKEIGELVVFDVAVLDNGQVASVQADKALIVTDNTGPATDYFPHSFVAGWDLAVCHNQRNFVAANIAPQPWNPQGVPQLVYSTDNGNTFTQMANLPPASKRVGGKIEVASDNTSNIVWVPCDGSREIYYTTNLGNSWTKATVEGTDGIMWNEHSYNKVLAADPNLPGTFYYITTGADFMRSTDNGATWAKTTTNSPPVGFHCVYKMVPGHEGHILYTPGIVDISSADLFFSENRGATFTTIPNVSEVATVAVGKAAPGASYPTVFIVGKVNGIQGVYLSTDKMETWQWMTDYPRGIHSPIRAMEGDPNSFGDLYGGFHAAGVWYAKYTGTPCSNFRTLTVVNGSGSGERCVGSEVSICATIPEGKVFLSWTGDTEYLDDPSQACTNVTMPASDISVTATYKVEEELDISNLSPSYYVLATLTTGIEYYTDRTFTITSIPSYLNGDTFVKTANSDKNGGTVSFSVNQTVDVYIAYDSRLNAPSWMSEFAVMPEIIGNTDSGFKLYKKTFPAGNVSLGGNEANSMYIVIIDVPNNQPSTYSLTVNNGTGDGSYEEATVVTIFANAAPAGQVFDQWTGDVANVTDVNASSTSIAMPATNVFITATYRDIQQNRGLVHQWKFNNNGHDEIGTADATLYNGGSYVTGYENLALHLDGSNSNQYAGVGVVDLGSAFTISMWAYNSGTQIHQNWLMANDDGVFGFKLYVNSYNTTDGRICFRTNSTNGSDYTTSATGAFPFNQWNHVAVTVESNGAYVIYANGAQVHYGTVMPGTPFNQNLDIGTQGHNTWNSWKGQIDNVKIFNYALSASEITNDVNNSLKSRGLILEEALVELSQKISLYPNPVSHGFVTIRNIDTSMEQLIISDMAGKVLYQKQLFNEDQAIFNAEGFAKGLYIVILKNGRKNDYLKLLVK